MNIHIIAFKRSLFIFCCILNGRRSAERISKNVFLFDLNAQCPVVIGKVSRQKIGNTCATAVSHRPNLYLALKLVCIFFNVLGCKVKYNISSRGKALMSSLFADSKVACPLLFIACASGHDREDRVSVLTFTYHLISNTDTHGLLRRLLRIVFVHIISGEIPLSEEILKILALKIIRYVGLLATDRCGGKDHRHSCQMLVIFSRQSREYTVRIVVNIG